MMRKIPLDKFLAEYAAKAESLRVNASIKRRMAEDCSQENRQMLLASAMADEKMAKLEEASAVGFQAGVLAGWLGL